MPTKRNDTAKELLDTAQSLVQERGYNAFSYKDLANAVGIRTASIHYHFPSKLDLGIAIMERYTQDLSQALSAIDGTTLKSKARIQEFISLYSQTEERGAICLCGSLASDRETLPEELQEAVARYLALTESWLTRTLQMGVERGDFSLEAEASDLAASLLSSLQGGLILSRARGGRPLLSIVEQVFLSAL